MAITQAAESATSPLHLLLVLGKPGAGKSTLTHRLSRQLGLHLIAIGNIARVEAAAGTELGERVDPYLLNMLLPAELVGEILARELADAGVREKGFLLDWTPRSLDDLESLCAVFSRYQLLSGLTAIYVQVSDAVVRERILQHRALLEQRISDTEQIVDQRLRQFAHTCPPVIEEIRQKGIRYRVIDGELEHEMVFRNFLACLNPGIAAESSRSQLPGERHGENGSEVLT